MLEPLLEVYPDLDISILEEEFRGPTRGQPNLQAANEAQEEASNVKDAARDRAIVPIGLRVFIFIFCIFIIIFYNGFDPQCTLL